MVRRPDDFSDAVLSRIKGEVNDHCSNPDCRAPTRGPSKQKGVSNVGVGAHITAASPGGPRYNSRLSSTRRKGAGNAIWLCGRCGRLVDNDKSTHTAQQLRQWKRDAIKRAHQELISGRRIPEKQAQHATAESQTARDALVAARTLVRTAEEMLLHTAHFVTNCRGGRLTRGLKQTMIIDPSNKVESAIEAYKIIIDRATMSENDNPKELFALYELVSMWLMNAYFWTAAYERGIPNAVSTPNQPRYRWRGVFDGEAADTESFREDMRSKFETVRQWCDTLVGSA